MKYKIKLLPDDKDSIRASQVQVMYDARWFVIQQMRRTSCGDLEHLDRRMCSLLDSVLNCYFWQTLFQIDGYRDDPPEKREEYRSWARKTFRDYDLEKLLNIAANQALLRPVEDTGRPGTAKGHSFLYERLVEMEDSMFQGIADKDLLKRLNNGRFWESLPAVSPGLNRGIGIYRVSDVLENHFDNLDVNFVRYGLELMRFALENRPLKEVYLSCISDKALDNYARFLAMIDESRSAPRSDIESLLKQYVSAVLVWDFDMEGPRYNGEEDFDGIRHGHFVDKLKAPVLQKYLKKSAAIRQYMAEELVSGIRLESNAYGEFSRFVKQVLDNVPQPKKIVKLMMERMMTEQGIRFFQQSEKHGHSLYPLMNHC